MSTKVISRKWPVRYPLELHAKHQTDKVHSHISSCLMTLCILSLLQKHLLFTFCIYTVNTVSVKNVHVINRPIRKVLLKTYCIWYVLENNVNCIITVNFLCEGCFLMPIDDNTSENLWLISHQPPSSSEAQFCLGTDPEYKNERRDVWLVGCMVFRFHYRRLKKSKGKSQTN